jgi:hypothetical protein
VLWVAFVLWCQVAAAEAVCLRVTGSLDCASGDCPQQQVSASGVTIGVLQDGTEAIITAGHCYRGLQQTNTLVHWYGGQQVPARLIAVSQSPDVALLAARLPSRPTSCVMLAESVPDGAPVESVGYARGRERMTRRGAWARGMVPGVQPQMGESGGPVYFDDGHQLAGLIVGYDDRGMIVETCQRIRFWMVGTIGYVPQCRPVPIVRQNPPAQPPIVRAPPPPVECEPCDCADRIRALESRLAALADQVKAIEDSRIRVQLRSNGKVVDEDSYPRTGPIILDFGPVQKPTGSR